jgi:hypothetical protein
MTDVKLAEYVPLSAKRIIENLDWSDLHATYEMAERALGVIANDPRVDSVMQAMPTVAPLSPTTPCLLAQPAVALWQAESPQCSVTVCVSSHDSEGLPLHIHHRPFAVRVIKGELRQSLASNGEAILPGATTDPVPTDMRVLLREDKPGAVFVIAPTQRHTIECPAGTAVLVIAGPQAGN